MSLRRTWAVLRKESRHILRDPVTFILLLLAADYLLAAFSMGILIATFISNQSVASIIGLLVFLFPGFFLTGIFYPAWQMRS